MEQLARERVCDSRELAERMRLARRQRALRRARRMEHRAERRVLQAWRRAAALRARLESFDY